GQVVDGRALAFPGAVGFKPQRANPAAPWRDHPADRAKVGAVAMLLIDLLNHIGRHADESTKGRCRLDAVLAAVPRRLENVRDLLEVVNEEPLRLFVELGR